MVGGHFFHEVDRRFFFANLAIYTYYVDGYTIPIFVFIFIYFNLINNMESTEPEQQPVEEKVEVPFDEFEYKKKMDK